MSKKSTRKSKFGYFFGYLILNLLTFSIGSGERGTVTLLSTKEFLNIELEWFALFNHISCTVGAICSILFTIAGLLIYRKYTQEMKTKTTKFFMNPQYNTI